MNTLLLMSGGVDSAALCYGLRPRYTLTIDYGQVPFSGELLASKKITDFLGINHLTLEVPMKELGSGDLAGRPSVHKGPGEEYTEWWPFRNQMLITLACMKAFQLGVGTIMIGSVKTDTIFVDGSSQFVAAMDDLVSIQEGKIRVKAPAQHMTTVELVRHYGVPESVLSMTHSCHISNLSCGTCWGCLKSLDVFEQVNLVR